MNLHQNRLIPFLIITLVLSIATMNHCRARNISVNYQQTSLKKVFQDLSKKTGNQFSYSARNINHRKKITYTSTQKNFEQILDEICKLSDLTFEKVGNYFILKRNLRVENKVIQLVEKTENYTLSGYVSNAENDEFFIGATVYLADKMIGVTTNNHGFYSITLPPKLYQFKASFLGFNSTDQQFNLNQNLRWDIELFPKATIVEEVLVASSSNSEIVQQKPSGHHLMTSEEVKKQVAALGESDVLKSLQQLPGISFHGEGSSYFYVRGGNRDQNLVLLDEAPLYNPTHMLGLFTPVIPEAVKTTNVYKSDFPIQYGGRLSSIIDIRTNDGNMEKFSGNASIGLLTARLTLEGPFKKNRSSWFISTRRSYFGNMLKAINNNINDLYFADFTSKLNFRIGQKDRLYLTLYSGKDIYKSGANNGLQWGNNSMTIRWNHILDDRLFLNTTFYTSKYDYYLYTNIENDLYWNSQISSIHAKPEFTYFINPDLKLKFGGKLGYYYFNPGNYSAPNLDDILTVSPINSNEIILYGGGNYNLTHNLKLQAGLRLNLWNNFGEAFIVHYDNYQYTGYTTYEANEHFYSNFGIEPRISLAYHPWKKASLKISYNRTLQNTHLINNSISPLNSLEAWLPSGPNIRPQKADIFDIGFVQNLNSILLQVDVFYKQLHNQIGFKPHADLLLNALIDGEIRQGDGRAHGFEIQAKKQQGRFTGQISYAYSRSFLQINGLNNGREYAARQDKPIDLSLNLSYEISKRWIAHAGFFYGSGMRYTTPTSFYNYRGTQVPVYSEMHNSRLPNYKHLDIGSKFILNRNPGKYEHVLQLSVYNLFNHKNASFLYFNKIEGNGSFKIPVDQLNNEEIVTTFRFLYGFLPSFTYLIKF